MNKLQKALQQVGIQYKKDHGIAKNSSLWVEILHGDRVEDTYIGSAQYIYCRQAGYKSTGINLYKYIDGGRMGYGYDPNTKQTVRFADLYS